LKWAEGTELGPMAKVYFRVGAPIFVLSEEIIFGANNLTLEEGCERGVVVGKTYYGSVMKQSKNGFKSTTDLEYASSRKGRIPACLHA
jgi:hypothetical protein